MNTIKNIVFPLNCYVVAKAKNRLESRSCNNLQILFHHRDVTLLICKLKQAERPSSKPVVEPLERVAILVHGMRSAFTHIK